MEVTHVWRDLGIFRFVVGIGGGLGARLRGWGGNLSMRLEIAVSSTSGSSLVNSVMAECEQQRL